MTTLAPPSLSAAIASSRPVPQAEIQHHDVRPQDARSVERLAYARSLADDLEALSPLQNAPDAAPDELVVVDEDDGDHGDADDTALRDIRNHGPCANRWRARYASVILNTTEATHDAEARHWRLPRHGEGSDRGQGARMASCLLTASTPCSRM